jgi:hypothetical protein
VTLCVRCSPRPVRWALRRYYRLLNRLVHLWEEQVSWRLDRRHLRRAHGVADLAAPPPGVSCDRKLFRSRSYGRYCGPCGRQRAQLVEARLARGGWEPERS